MLRILHVFRMPVGGLFRHVRDLARGQSERGHAVGLLCDSTTGGEEAAGLLARSADHCSLGVTRVPISRLPGLGDAGGVRLTLAHAKRLKPDIIHCHGAKGGLHGRIAGRLLGIPTLYAPHGGSLHYDWRSFVGAGFLGAEWLLARVGHGFHFVCDFEKAAFAAKIGLAGKSHAVVHNGLWPEEFVERRLNPDAADILFVGEMRRIKGVDVLLRAMASMERRVTACLVGEGAEQGQFQDLARSLGVAANFAGRLPAAEAFRRGRLLVMPSRAESFPYVVLEAVAAGVPILASRVGGIPEVLAADCLVPPEDPAALAAAIGGALAESDLERRARAERDRMRNEFSAGRMVERVLELYALLLRSGTAP